MLPNQLKPGVIVRGPIFPEPVQVVLVTPMGTSVKLIGKGLTSGKLHDPILTPDQLTFLEATPETEPFDGDPKRFRLGIEALRLALAYEYDPYFSLSIARVDPLPHQLEAVYDYAPEGARPEGPEGAPPSAPSGMRSQRGPPARTM
jgi:hypothetical protein